MAVRRRKKVSLDTDLLLNTVIATVVTQQAPKLLNQFLFKNNPLTGITLGIAGGASAYLVGLLMENNEVANIGLALAGADLINDVVTPLISGVVGDFVSLPGSYTPVQLNDWTQSNDLTSQSMIQSVMNN